MLCSSLLLLSLCALCNVVFPANPLDVAPTCSVGRCGLFALQGRDAHEDSWPQPLSPSLPPSPFVFWCRLVPCCVTRGQIVATALTGDPDLYVTVGGSDLPGPNNFYWMGGATGEVAKMKKKCVLSWFVLSCVVLISFFPMTLAVCVHSLKIVVSTQPSTFSVYPVVCRQFSLAKRG